MMEYVGKSHLARNISCYIMLYPHHISQSWFLSFYPWRPIDQPGVDPQNQPWDADQWAAQQIPEPSAREVFWGEQKQAIL